MDDSEYIYSKVATQPSRKSDKYNQEDNVESWSETCSLERSIWSPVLSHPYSGIQSTSQHHLTPDDHNLEVWYHTLSANLANLQSDFFSSGVSITIVGFISSSALPYL